MFRALCAVDELEDTTGCGAADNDVHWFDSCDLEGSLVTACDSCETCTEPTTSTATFCAAAARS